MKKTLKKFVQIFFSVFLLASFTVTLAEKYENLEATNYVNDFANILSDEEEKILNDKLAQLDKTKKVQIAVAVVSDMDGDYVEHYAFKLYEKWGIGGEARDEGALFLVSVNDRQMRIEVGYGLEPVLTDGVTKNILDNFVAPEFKSEKYFDGINLGVDKMLEVLGGGTLPEQKTSENNMDWPTIIFVIFIVGINILGWLFAILARTKSWWLGGVITTLVGFPVLYFFGFSILNDIIFFFFAMFGFIFDYFISKNYKYWEEKLKVSSDKHGPDWWAGGTWGPGSGGFKSGGGGFGGFGGGMSGGGGSSSSW